MEKLSGNEIRERFLKYFEDKEHTRVASSSLVPHNDPTLLFTNAGMVQFKDVFLGIEKKGYRRAATSQKCVRAGGKHNDLDTVGRTARHHTFFEMLGNFSFGDYFKAEAISFAWELLTEEFGLPKDKLWITIYLDDDEAFALWQEKAGVPADRIIRLGEKDNFWSMGETGPCGPCSEILIDRGEERSCGASECGIGKCDCDRWLEIWNLVFMQYNRDDQGVMTPLPKPSIDTGMGLERIASVLQQVDSNYDTDLLQPIIQAVEAISNLAYQRDEGGFPFRVIADHIRACTFLINDGVLPGNEGRGYVLRRILRRAVRFGKVLDIQKPFMYQLVPVVLELMAGAYPELKEKRSYIEKVMKIEEERFHETLHDGMKIAADIIARLKTEGKQVIAGKDAFMLYDTFGFPLDLTEDIGAEAGLAVDKAGFMQEMEKQRERARAARTDVRASEESIIYSEALAGFPATQFSGYTAGKLTTRLEAIVDLQEKAKVGRAEAGQTIALLLAETPFYPAAGGQVADTGTIAAAMGRVAVTDVLKLPDGKIIHKGEVSEGFIEVGATVTAEIDRELRLACARNHTATHLLHEALRQVLGEHVNQAGSLVSPERLRFDLTHFSAISPEELEEIERLVNEIIFSSLSVEAFETELEQAKAMGAAALFGEKYGDVVRVVKMGDYSLELCGGTHLENTSQAGIFRIASEGGIGAGLRRIEALTGKGALQQIKKEQQVLKNCGMLLKTPPLEAETRVEALLNQLKETEKELVKMKDKLAGSQVEELLAKVEIIQGVKVLSIEVQAAGMDDLRNTADLLRNKLGSGVVLAGAISDDKVNLVAMATKDAVQQGVHAGNLVKEVAKVVDGGGGGRPDMAQAGGKNPAKLTDALELVPEVVAAQLQQAKF
jgi:alanyl-tRNA synthetase